MTEMTPTRNVRGRNHEEAAIAVDKFKIQGRTLFLTYPQCSTAKEDALEAIVNIFGENVQYAIVSREDHGDADPVGAMSEEQGCGVHLHCAIRFDRRIQVSGVPGLAKLDGIAGKHGHYLKAKTWKALVRYVCKDGDYCVYVKEGMANDIDKILSDEKPKHIANSVAKLAIDGKGYDDIVDEHPGFAMVNKRKIDEFISYQEVKRARSELQEWAISLLRDDLEPGTAGAIIIDWLKENIKVGRQHRQKQLFITGPPACGKSSLINRLRDFCTVYDVPHDEDFYDGYESNLYDVCAFDEFCGQKRIQWMNTFLEGQKTRLRLKGAQVLKSDNPACIILSNYTLEDCYPNMSTEARHRQAWDAFRSRVIEVRIRDGEFLDIFKDIEVPVAEAEELGSEDTEVDERLETKEPEVITLDSDGEEEPEQEGAFPMGLGTGTLTPRARAIAGSITPGALAQYRRMVKRRLM